jgi:hypothetical protein
MPLPPEAVPLHRYFIWANRMRTHADEVLPKMAKAVEESQSLGSQGFTEWFLYLSYWYGGLYVVIEGWRELALTDPTVDGLLQRTELVELLRRYRNGSFHFQREYFDDRFTGFIQEQGSVAWVRDLNRAFGAYFLQRLRE